MTNLDVSCCTIWIDTHPVKSKFTPWHLPRHIHNQEKASESVWYCLHSMKTTIHCVKWCYCHTLWSTCNARNFLFVDEFDTIILFCWTLSYNLFSVGFSTRVRFFQYGVTHPPHRGLVSGLWFVFIKSEK